MFPTCSEILEVIRGLGYARLTEEEKTLLAVHGISSEVCPTCNAASELAESN